MDPAHLIRSAKRSRSLRPILFALHALASSFLALRTSPAFFRCTRCRILALAVVLLWWKHKAWILQAIKCSSFGFVFVVAIKLLDQIVDNAGHRAGTEGYEGKIVENTIEALEQFSVHRQASEPYYVEVDVQETMDGILVLYHDTTGGLLRGFPCKKTNLKIIRSVEARGIPWNKARIRDLNLEEVQAMKLGEEMNAIVPTLDKFLEHCRKLKVACTVAVEVKDVHSKKGKEALIRALATYKKTMMEEHPDEQPSYKIFGWVCLLAFPSTFAKCFGEFGSTEWKYWCRMLKKSDVPARSCVFHRLDLTTFS